MVENSGGPGIWGLHLKNVLVGEHVSRVSVALISDDGCKTIIADHTGGGAVSDFKPGCSSMNPAVAKCRR